MAKVRRSVVEHNPEAGSHELHHLLVDLVRYASLLQPDQPTHGTATPLSQVFALHELDGAAPLSQRDLADRLRLEKSTVSRLVADMEEAGLLVRERQGRYSQLRLTARGRNAHAKMAKAFHGRHGRLLSSLTTSERQALLVGLPALIRVLREQADYALPITDAGEGRISRARSAPA